MYANKLLIANRIPTPQPILINDVINLAGKMQIVIYHNVNFDYGTLQRQIQLVSVFLIWIRVANNL